MHTAMIEHSPLNFNQPKRGIIMHNSTLTALFATFTVFMLFSMSYGAVIVINENFEGATAGSGTPPTGWSFIDEDGTSSYVTSATGTGSDGAGGSSGLGGEVSAGTAVVGGIPAAYLVFNTAIDLTSGLSGTFDFQLLSVGSRDDGGIILGDVADGYDHDGSTGTAGEFLYANLTEYAPNSSSLHNGAATPLASGQGIVNDTTWYRATVTWTPTSGLTGDFSLTVNNFTSDLFTMATTGFTFDSANGFIGFGSVNDSIRFDNVIFSSEIPEPSTAILAGLGLMGACFRRRRRK
ncbi:MAG: PEP-CTERM sorting domain-containing protein [Lentisphaeria bacterium]|nr:PEP-CTERM sorting domain-containing protein [Lentisphaeria bacterium]